MAFVLLPFSAAAQVMITAPGGAQQQVTPPASKVPPEQRCVLSGTVTNALTGEPVKKATVRLINQSGGSAPGGVAMGGFIAAGPVAGGQGYSTTSEADGSFQFENVEPGTYLLSGSRTGFLNTRFGSKDPRQMGTAITLAPSQSKTGIGLALTPQAVISGKVLDEDGEPTANVMVQLLAATWQRGKLQYLPRQALNTNDLGEFRLASISPGKYFVAAQKMAFFGPAENTAPATKDKPDIRPIRTYYPGTPNMESATPIEMKAGQDLNGIEIRLQTAPTFHVRGKVAGAPDDAQQQGAVILRPRNAGGGFFITMGQSQIKPDGSFDISGVPAGAYVVSLMMMAGQVRSAARLNVDVGSADVNDLALIVTKPGSLHGQIRIEGTPAAGVTPPDLGNLHVNLFPAEMGMMMGPPPRSKVNADGSFNIENVAATSYTVNAPAPNGTYLKSILYGQTDVMGHELDLSGGASGELQVVLRYGPGEISGTVQPPQNSTGAPSSVSAQVVILPETPNADGSGMRLASTDTAGAFDFKQITPGRYRAYAFEQLDAGQLQNPEVLKQLEAKGAPLDVKENDRKQISLSLISAEELQQLLARAGIESSQ